MRDASCRRRPHPQLLAHLPSPVSRLPARAAWLTPQAEAESAVLDARFEADAEKELRTQLQAANDALREQLRAEQQHAEALGTRVAHLEAECDELRVVARTAEAAQADAEARAARLAAVSAARDAHDAATATAAATAASGRYVQHAPASQSPSEPSAYAAGNMEPLVELLCAALDASGSGRVSEDELTAFLATVNSIQPIGHSPRIKARALCREFGDSRSISIDAFRTILSKLAEGDHAKLLRLVSAVVKAGLATPPLVVGALR